MSQFITPVPGALTQSYKAGTHNGIDIGSPDRSTVVASDSGRVIYEGIWGSGGNTIIIKGSDGWSTYYCHLSRFIVNMGATVQQGDPIAQSGGALGEIGAGNATGPHLHFEIHNPQGQAVDPQQYISIAGSVLSVKNTPPIIGSNNPIGQAANNINKAISKPLDALGKTVAAPFNLAASSGAIIGFLTSSSNWKRIGLFSAGAILLTIVVVKTLGDSSAIKSVAELAAKAA